MVSLPDLTSPFGLYIFLAENPALLIVAMYFTALCAPKT